MFRLWTKRLHRLIGVTVGLLESRGDGQPAHQSRRLSGADRSAPSGRSATAASNSVGAVVQARGTARLFVGLFEHGVDSLASRPRRPAQSSSAFASACWRYSFAKVLRDALAPCRSQSSGCSGRRAGRSGWTGWRWPPAPRSSAMLCGSRRKPWPVEKPPWNSLMMSIWRAGGGQRVEIEVVDVDIALPVGLGLLRGQQVSLVVGSWRPSVPICSMLPIAVLPSMLALSRFTSLWRASTLVISSMVFIRLVFASRIRVRLAR